MYRGKNPRILPIIIIIVVVALIIAAIFSIGRMILSNSTNSNQPADQSSLISDVLNTEDGRGVTLTVRGPIVADEEFKSYQINITPTSRTYTVYRGYLDNVISRKTYENNRSAYEQFVYALDKADIAKTRKSNDDGDLRGVCATGGLAYKFETILNNEVKDTLWTSTCEGSRGTMAASVDRVHALFANQIPDFEPLFNQYH